MSQNDDESRLGLEATDVLPPARLVGGKYRLGRLLGEGGMGAVYEAEHTGLGTLVAVKLLNESFASDSNALSRFRREARATAAIRHENIVAVSDTGTDEQGIPFIVMEQLEGESLSAYLRRERKLTPEVATAITLQVLAGLAAAHDKKVIHRDLKPGNIILATQPDGTQLVKVLDFGISKFYTHGIPDVTATGAVIGTPRFMAPEQARGDSDVDARVDIYAVGVLLYRMLTAKLPFSGGDQRAIIERILAGHPPALREHESSVPKDLERVVMRALAADRADRPQSARAFIAELQEAMPNLGHEPIRIRVPTSNLSTASVAATSPGPSIPSLMAVGPSDVETRKDSAGALRRERAAARRRLLSRTTLALVVAVVVGGGVFYALRETSGGGKVAPPLTDKDLFVAGKHFPGKTVRFGITRYLPKNQLGHEHAPLIHYLANKLERPVKLEVLDGYVNLAEKLGRGELEVVGLAAYAYVRAKRGNPGLRLIASHVTSSGHSYDGVIVARAESGIRTLNDLRGKNFCFVSHISSSGYIYPRAEFRRDGLDPDTAFKAVLFAGDHLSALRMVYDGACAGAAVFSGMFYEAKKHGMSPERFKILRQTRRIPYDAYCVHDRLPRRLADGIRDALLALKPRSTLARRVLGEHSRIQGFYAAKDAEYNSVRKIERFLDHTVRKRLPKPAPETRPTTKP